MNAAHDDKDARAAALNLRVVQIRPKPAAPAAPTQPAPDAPTAQQLRKGRVAGRIGQAFSVELPDHGPTVSARRAAGCLLLPQVEDVVLLLFDDAGGEHYVLNVLERESQDRTLDFPGDAAIQAPQGALNVQAGVIGLQGARKAEISGQEVALTAALGRMRFGRLDLLADSLDAGLRRVRAVGERLHLTASHLISRLGRAVRSTGFELHRAGRMRTEVEKSYAVKAGRASILARDDVTVDAEKINLG